MTKFRKILLAVFFIGFAGNVGGSGTMASFNASTTNANTAFATGSIVLSNTNNNTANTCFSNGTGPTDGGTSTATDDNHNDSCEAMFNVATQQPGQTATAELNIKNEGSLPGTLHLLAALHTPPAAPTTAVTACSNRDAADTAYHGTGDICQQLQLTIQRYTTDTRDVVYTTAPGGCVYGVDTEPDNACELDATRNLKEFTETSAAASAPGISLGNLAASGEAGDTAFITITVHFPDGGVGADNAFQGRVATMAMQWLLEQV